MEDRWQAFMEMPARDDIDEFDLAESAQDAAVAQYDILSLPKREIYSARSRASTTSGNDCCVISWNANSTTRSLAKPVSNTAWHANINGVVGLLGAFGWNIRTENFYPHLEGCRLIVNVYKHGKGKSFDQLIT